jgi:hypothetical protein
VTSNYDVRQTLQSIAWTGFGVVEVLAVIGIAPASCSG